MDNKSKNNKSYLRKISELVSFSKLKNEHVKILRNELRTKNKQDLDYAKFLIEQMVESEEDLSYIFTDEYGKIIASTPTFRRVFHYNDEDKPIKGRLCYNALKIPSNTPDYIGNLREVLQTHERLKRSATIYNGKGEERIIMFKKHKSYHYKLGSKDYFFNRVDVYDIGWVERGLGQVKRMLHSVNGEASTLEEFITKKILAEHKRDSDLKRDEILSEWKKKTPKQKRNAAKTRLKQMKKNQKTRK